MLKVVFSEVSAQNLFWSSIRYFERKEEGKTLSAILHFMSDSFYFDSTATNEIKFTFTAQINDVYNIHLLYIHWTNHASATTDYFEWSFRPFLFFNRDGEANFAIFSPLIRMFHWAKFLCLPSSGLEYQITSAVPSDFGLVPKHRAHSAGTNENKVRKIILETGPLRRFCS